MVFSLFEMASGGTVCWTESHSGGNAVNVTDGLFDVLLGSILPIDSNCLANTAFLQMSVNNETLSPRQLLADVAHSVTTDSLLTGGTLGTILTPK